MQGSRGIVSAFGAMVALALSCAVAVPAVAQGAAAKPNILVIFGDDVGQSNISAYTHGRGGLQDARTSTASPGKA